MYAIAGSGFGLYGYLPAVVERMGGEAVLPRAYEAKIRARPELARALAGAHFVEDLDAALALADTVIVATPPARQVEIVEACLALPNVLRLLLEKPLAPTPEAGAALLARLRASGKHCRIGYTLLHARWHDGLAWPRGGAAHDRVDLSWSFMAHHFAQGLQNWKRSSGEGGGVLRFFGIHVVALMAERGYERVAGSVLEGARADEPERWRAVFSGPALPDCQVLVNSRSELRRFAIEASGSAGTSRLLDLGDPFDLETAEGAEDRRVGLLERLLRSFDQEDARHLDLYRATNTLWQAAERP